LKQQGFDIEAIVAFDCVMQSLTRFFRVARNLPKELTRRELCERLNLPCESAALADYVYFLRNNFGAHAGGWRWWDLGEVLGEEELTKVGQLAGAALANAADSEPQMRSLEPFPALWGEWLFENFETLWDVLWFEKLNRWEQNVTT
jgi:hypothetical protein